MTRLESAINFFSNQSNCSGTLQKIYAYDLAEQSLCNIRDIICVLNSLNKKEIDEIKACQDITDIIKNPYK